MTTCSVCCPQSCPDCHCEGERRKAKSLALLADHREAVLRRAQRALLTVLLETGSATIDDVRELVELPPGVNPKVFGAAPGVLARAGIIEAAGFTKTCRPTAHARPVSVWTLADRAKALRWLNVHPDLPDPRDDDQGEAVQGILFPTTNEPTPTDAAAGAGMEE